MPLGSSLRSLASFVRDVVLLNDVAGQPAALANGEAVIVGPGANLLASLSASSGGSDPAARPLRGNQPGTVHIGSKLAAEVGGVPGSQVYLVAPAVYPELHRLVGWAAGQVIFQSDFEALHWRPPTEQYLLPAAQTMSWRSQSFPSGGGSHKSRCISGCRALAAARVRTTAGGPLPGSRRASPGIALLCRRFDSLQFFRIINGMARTVSVIVTDDLDGSPDAQAVKFGFDGVSYEIDLGKKNRAKLDRAVAKYIEAGRRTSRSSGRVSAQRSPARRGDLAAVRAWAKEHGLNVSDRGRISAEVIRQYEAAH
jgi:hypothetical protein